MLYYFVSSTDELIAEVNKFHNAHNKYPQHIHTEWELWFVKCVHLAKFNDVSAALLMEIIDSGHGFVGANAIHSDSLSFSHQHTQCATIYFSFHNPKVDGII